MTLRMDWFDQAFTFADGDADENGLKDMITTVAHLADENGSVSLDQIEDFYGFERGSLDLFGDGTRVLHLSIPPG